METERLILRKPEPGDLDRFEKLFNTDFVTQYLCMEKLDRAGCLAYLEQMARGEKDLALVRKADGGFIGKIHLDPDNLRYEVKAVSLSYWVGEPYARQGYMMEALKALLDRLFREEGYEIVSAQVLTPNTASAALLEKLGFTREGGLRRALRWRGALYDNLLYSLTREEAARRSGQGPLPTL